MRGLLTFLFILFGCLPPLSAGGPENAILVINSQSASSKLVANFYIDQRNIPATNVVYLDNIPQGELIKLEVFKERILKPLLLEIDNRKLSNQIDYVIYSSGFPTKVDARSVHAAMRNSDNRHYQNLVKSKASYPELSLTSATFYYQSILTNQYEIFLGLTSNYYYRGKTNNTLTRPFYGEDQSKFLKATRLARAKDLEQAVELLTELANKHPQQMATHYWLARVHAQQDDAESAANAMRRAIQCGWVYRAYTKTDAALGKLKDNTAFQEVIQSMPDVSFHALASQSFQGQNAWSYNGSINAGHEQGQRYLLSTMLSVTRNLGISERQTINYLKRSVSADDSMPQGKFYFTKSQDVRTKTRIPNFSGAIQELKQLGYSSEIVIGQLPKNRFDVLGLMIGTPKFKWKPSGSQILPGAICDNLTSYGGWLQAGKTGQTKLSEFLKHGAAGSCGTVREPYAMQVKFPHPRLHVHYVQGCTLAEAFYQSVQGPFQLLIVGDALCRPFAKDPTIVITGDLQPGAKISGKASLFVDTSKSETEIKQTEIFVNGIRMLVVEDFGQDPIVIDTTTLPDGYHEFRFVPVSAGNIAVKGQVIVPVTVDNRGHSVELTLETSKPRINSNLSFRFNAPGANKVRLVHNSRIIAESDQSSGTFNIKAFELGRGNVSVGAVADIDGTNVSSAPVELNIEGFIAGKIPIQRSQNAPKPSRPKQANPNTKSAR